MFRIFIIIYLLQISFSLLELSNYIVNVSCLCHAVYHQPKYEAQPSNLFVCFVCLFDLFLYVHSTIFQLCGTVLPGFNQY